MSNTFILSSHKLFVLRFQVLLKEISKALLSFHITDILGVDPTQKEVSGEKIRPLELLDMHYTRYPSRPKNIARIAVSRICGM